MAKRKGRSPASTAAKATASSQDELEAHNHNNLQDENTNISAANDDDIGGDKTNPPNQNEHDGDEEHAVAPADKAKRKRNGPSDRKKADTDNSNNNNNKPKATRKRTVASTRNAMVDDESNKPAVKKEESYEITDTSKPRATRKRTVATAPKVEASKKATQDTEEEKHSEADVEVELDETTKPKATRKRGSAPVVQSLTTRDELPRLWNAEEAQKNHGSYNFKIASWNVAGLRALLRNVPNALVDFLQNHDLDVLCLQETKLQESHLDDPQLLQFRDQLSDLGYHIYYSCSTERKGYSGTAIMIRRGRNSNPIAHHDSGQVEEPTKKKAKKQTNLKNFFGSKKNEATATTAPATTAAGGMPSKSNLPQPVEQLFASAKVSYGIGKAEHDGEGRVIVLDFPLFSLCNVYTPNSGQDLKRLSYRVEQWDKDFLSFIQHHSQDRRLPILWLGDLNIAHRALDVYNDGAKHLLKQAGVTPQERASFTQQLTDSGFVDAFRHLHPTAQGHYTYWSTRAGNREANKGLRLDYFVCDPVLLEEEKSNVLVRDSYMVPEIKGSDHCPIVLELEIKASSQTKF